MTEAIVKLTYQEADFLADAVQAALNGDVDTILTFAELDQLAAKIAPEGPEPPAGDRADAHAQPGPATRAVVRMDNIESAMRGAASTSRRKNPRGKGADRDRGT